MSKLLEVSLEEVRERLGGGGALVAQKDGAESEARRCPGFGEEVYVVLTRRQGLDEVTGSVGLAGLMNALGYRAPLSEWEVVEDG